MLLYVFVQREDVAELREAHCQWCISAKAEQAVRSDYHNSTLLDQTAVIAELFEVLSLRDLAAYKHSKILGQLWPIL